MLKADRISAQTNGVQFRKRPLVTKSIGINTIPDSKEDELQMQSVTAKNILAYYHNKTALDLAREQLHNAMISGDEDAIAKANEMLDLLPSQGKTALDVAREQLHNTIMSGDEDAITRANEMLDLLPSQDKTALDVAREQLLMARISGDEDAIARANEILDKLKNGN